MSITLAQLRAQVRKRADMEESQFIEDSELDFYINQSIKELHDILTDAFDSDYYLSSYEFNTNSNDEAYDLPSDLYHLRGVDVKSNSQDWLTISKFNFNERNRFQEPTTWASSELPQIRYRLTGSQIRFNPRPDRQTTIRLWYYPKAVELVDPADTFDDINGFSEYVIVDAAIKCKDKQEDDVTVLAAQKDALTKRISEKSQKRDAANPTSVYDIYAENDDFYWRNRS
jgi:hypothetical protein